LALGRGTRRQDRERRRNASGRSSGNLERQVNPTAWSGSAAGGLDLGLGDPDLALEAGALGVVGRVAQVVLGVGQAPAGLLEVDLRDRHRLLGEHGAALL